LTVVLDTLLCSMMVAGAVVNTTTLRRVCAMSSHCCSAFCWQ
jgi:hypothetical protein